MRTLIFLVLTIASLPPVCSGQIQVFDKLYNFNPDNSKIESTIWSCHADTDRFYVCGETFTAGVSTLHGFVSAFNFQGQLLWNKYLYFPGPYNGFPNFNCLEKIGPNRNLLVGVNINKTVNSKIDILEPYIYLFNSNGDSLYAKIISDSFETKIYSSATLHNGYIITSGVWASKELSNSGGGWYPDYTAALLTKLDTLGNIIWEKRFMKISNTSIGAQISVPSVVLSSNGLRYTMAGSLYDTSKGKYGSSIIQTDTNGNLLWVKQIPKPYLSVNDVHLIANPGGGYYFVTAMSKLPPFPPPNNSHNVSWIYYGKLSEQGDTIWTRTVNPNADSSYTYDGYKIELSKTGDLVVLGTIGEGYRPVIFKADTLGNIKWYHEYYRINHFHPYQNWNSLALIDNYVLTTGYIQSQIAMPGIYDTAGYIGWMAILDSNGCRGPQYPDCWPLDVEDNYNVKPLTIYPNPVSDVLSFSRKITGILSIVDVTGREIVTHERITNTQFLNVQPLVKGIFILVIKEDNKHESRYKFYKE